MRLAAPTAHKARRGRVQESVGRPWSEYPEMIQEPADRRLRGMSPPGRPAPDGIDDRQAATCRFDSPSLVAVLKHLLTQEYDDAIHHHSPGKRGSNGRIGPSSCHSAGRSSRRPRANVRLLPGVSVERALFGCHARGERPSTSDRRRYIRLRQFQAGPGQERTIDPKARIVDVSPCTTGRRD